MQGRMALLTQHALAVFLSTAILGVMAALSIWWQQPIIMPSVASVVFLQTMTPTAPSARLWNSAVGQFVGEAAGFFAVFAVSAATAPDFLAHHSLLWSRAAAIVIATCVTGIGQLLLKAISAAGVATAVVVATGVETANWAGAGRLAVGIAVVTVLGEASRLLLLRVRGHGRQQLASRASGEEPAGQDR